MRLGPVVVHVAPTMYLDRFVFVDGRRFAPVLTDVKGEHAVFGRGYVLALGGLMVWCTVDLRRVAL